MENNFKETIISFNRLLIYCDGLPAYLPEMARWWKALLQKLLLWPQQLSHLATTIGYKNTTSKKQNQTRFALLELELVTQFLHTIAGICKNSSSSKCDNLSVYKPSYLKILFWIMKNPCSLTQKCQTFQEMQPHANTRGRSLTISWDQCASQELSGKM